MTLTKSTCFQPDNITNPKESPTPHIYQQRDQREQQWLSQQLLCHPVVIDSPLHPSITAFQRVISQSPSLTRLSNAMFTEALAQHYTHDPIHQPAIPSFAVFLQTLNRIIQHSPPFQYIPQDPIAMGEVGLPINTMLNWPMGTVSGLKFFADARVNAALREVLGSWGGYLASSQSRETMGGWMGKVGKEVMAEAANLDREEGKGKEVTKKKKMKKKLNFEEIYVCPDLEDEHLGFASWDAFFTREFQPGVRPVRVPDDWDLDNLLDPRSCSSSSGSQRNDDDPTFTILHACEAAPFRIAHNAQLHDKYWLKGQPYSLADMLGGSSAGPHSSSSSLLPQQHRHHQHHDGDRNRNRNLVERFAGGTVYQAFLGAFSYHRWHAPVSGVVEAIEHVPGTYFSMNYHQGLAAYPGSSPASTSPPASENKSDANGHEDSQQHKAKNGESDDRPKLNTHTDKGPDPNSANRSMAYLSAVATRTVIYIRAANPQLGLVALVFVGMAEVSSCEVTVGVGQWVRKGEEIGMFHYGGSTYCLVLQASVTVRFLLDEGWEGAELGEKRISAVKSALGVLVVN